MIRDAATLSQPVSRHVKPVETTIQADLTIADAIRSLRSRKIGQTVVYFYVVDGDNRLVGVVPTRTLLLEEPTRAIRDVMIGTVISINADMTLELALELFAMHRLLALPVVDADGRLLGVVDVQLYADETFDLAESRRRDDLFQLMGVSLEQARHAKAILGFRLRMPWLTANIAGGLICAAIGAAFDDVLAKVVVLSMFIPLVLTLSESISIQSMTMSLQFMHGRDVPWKQVRRRLNREWRTSLLLGIASAIMVSTVALLWVRGGSVTPVGVIGVSIAATMVFAAMEGALVPVLLHAARLDPRLASGPLVLVLADILALTTYLGLGTWWLL